MKEVKCLILAAGLGTRLLHLTDNWPKCLMPIGERPLLEYWLETICVTKVNAVLVNLHHHSEIVKEFLDRPRFKGWVHSVYEETLLGTAGTLRVNKDFFNNCTTLFVHADNWCQCDFTDFMIYHQKHRPNHCLITMMTFETDTPETCGIVETDADGVVQAFHEKKKKTPGNHANGAVYLMEPDVLKWIEKNPTNSDFSTGVLPNFSGRIATWKNGGIHKDIGVPQILRMAQNDPQPNSFWPQKDTWQKNFLKHPIHNQITKVVV